MNRSYLRRFSFLDIEIFFLIKKKKRIEENNDIKYSDHFCRQRRRGVLSMSTVMDRSHMVSADETHHRNKNRKFLRIVLIFVGMIILLASLFLINVIYRKLKSGKLVIRREIQDDGSIFRKTK